MPEATDFFDNKKITMVEVAKTEEKKTDVSLAVHLVADACKDRYDAAMLFSNDSDISEAVGIATKECHKKVRLYIKRGAKSFKALCENASYIGYITPKILGDSQMPENIALPDGRVIKKPKGW